MTSLGGFHGIALSTVQIHGYSSDLSSYLSRLSVFFSFPRLVPETTSISLRGLRPPPPILISHIHTPKFFFFFFHCEYGIARAGPRFRRALSEMHNSLAPLGGNSAVL